MNDKTTISQQNAKILFTGGGTGGHVYPNLALVPEFEKRGFEIAYAGGEGNTLERRLARAEGIKYYAVPSINSCGRCRARQSKTT